MSEYLSKDKLSADWCEWNDTGVISDELVCDLSAIAVGISKKSSFSRYSRFLKEDMVHDAIVKCLKNLKNVKKDKLDKLFNYFTLACYCAFVQTLKDHYKYINIRRELFDKAQTEYQEQFGHPITLDMSESQQRMFILDGFELEP